MRFSLFTVGVFAAGAAAAAGPVRVVVPFPAGGPTDMVARPYAQLLGEALKTTVIVDNRGGAGGAIGAELVAKSAPDGATLLMATVGTHAINASLYRKLAYDPVRDFTPIALVAAAPVAVVAHPSLPVRDVKSLVALAKAHPGNITFGTAGNGTPGHLTGEMFKAAAAVNLQHVPYKGSAPAVIDLVGGHLQLMFDPLQSVIAQVQGGRLRALAVSSASRAAVVPNVPTIAESGYPGFETTAWWGVFAPANLPAAQAASLTAESEKIARGPGFAEKLVPLGVAPTARTLGAFADFQRAELAKWGKAVRDSGATVD
ncbi:MAG TPA: tripartite tricarboxylate transporter substrate-binding protein [Burkholderiales bacterium]|nr:tripartite tricarboxylate transporter substrate-binding protein [Burkholderiales bacterium]